MNIIEVCVCTQGSQLAILRAILTQGVIAESQAWLKDGPLVIKCRALFNQSSRNQKLDLELCVVAREGEYTYMYIHRACTFIMYTLCSVYIHVCVVITEH